MARNDRKKQIIEYKAVGHTSKETAEHFGISPDYVISVDVYATGMTR